MGFLGEEEVTLGHGAFVAVDDQLCPRGYEWGTRVRVSHVSIVGFGERVEMYCRHAYRGLPEPWQLPEDGEHSTILYYPPERADWREDYWSHGHSELFWEGKLTKWLTESEAAEKQQPCVAQ